MSERDTRRAPHMERYVSAGRDCCDKPALFFRVGNQSFTFYGGVGLEDDAQAEWMRDMLCIALDALVKETRLQCHAGYR